MPASPANLQTDIVAYDIAVNGNLIKSDYQVLSIEVEGAINRVGTAAIVFHLATGAGEDESFLLSESDDFTPGQSIEIAIGSGSEKTTIFKGIIVHQSIRNAGDQNDECIVRCSEASVKMSLGNRSKNYANMTDSAIIAAVLADHGLPCTVESTSVTHNQLIQYQCNDWDFVIERAAANGLLVYTEDGKVTVKKPLSSGSPVLLINFGTDVISYDFGIDSRFQLSSVTCSAWDSKTLKMVDSKSAEPTLSTHGNLDGRKLGDGLNANPALYGAPVPLDKEETKNWADALLLKSRLAKMTGTVTFFGNALPKLNTLVQLSGFGKRFNGNPMVSSIRHEVRSGAWQTTLGFGMQPEAYHTQPPVNAPSAGGLLPAVQGLQQGVVLKISDDPDGAYRIKVDAPLLLGNNDGIWARLIQFYATSGKGSFFLPEVGDEVILGFLNNDPRFPVIIGSVYGISNKPMYTPDAQNSMKAIITKNDLKIELDDAQKILTISTPGGNQFVLSDKDQSICLKDQSGNKIEMTSSGISLDSIKDVSIKAKGEISLNAVQDIALSTTGGNVSLDGLNVDAKAQVAASVQGSASAELKSTGTTTVKGSMIMIN